MANKVLEMAIAIKGKLDGGLSSSVSKASQELNKLSNVIKINRRNIENYKLYRKRLVMLAIGTQQLQLSKS